MNKITRIVLTGGPCAGKTTGLAQVEQRLTSLGYTVVIMEEMATQAMKSGVNITNLKEDFQYLLVKLQKQRDEIYNETLKNIEGNIVILYDRGILDGKAYSEEKEFADVLRRVGLKENEVRGYYDAVFHLSSVAIGAEEYYTKENNKVRIESTIEEAVDADHRTLNCWVGHKHLRVIDNEGKNFNQKIDYLVKEILAFLGEPEPLEIERKFLIKKPDLEILEKQAVKIPIFQTYLKADKDSAVERRVRMTGENGDFNYYYTEKTMIEQGIRREIERRLSAQEYLSLLSETDWNLRPIRKTRYCFVYKNKYYELDIYPSWDNHAILEIEVNNLNENIEIPDFITLVKEVTGDKNYDNINLAKLNNTLDL